MYPAGPSTDRLAQSDMHVGGYFIPKGTIFWISLYSMQNMASIHNDPTIFKPVSIVDVCHILCHTYVAVLLALVCPPCGERIVKLLASKVHNPVVHSVHMHELQHS